MTTVEPNCAINWHYKEGYVRATLTIPDLKTQFAGINKRKVDPNSADVSVSFEGNEAHVRVTMRQGTKAGTIYEKRLDKDDLRDRLVAPAPDSYWKVEDGAVKLYIRTR